MVDVVKKSGSGKKVVVVVKKGSCCKKVVPLVNKVCSGKKWLLFKSL